MEGRSLPDYVEQEFDAYLKCGRLEEGFLRVRCEAWHAEKLLLGARAPPTQARLIGCAAASR